MFDAFTLTNERAFDREILVVGAGGLLSGLVVSGLHLIAGAPVAELSVLGFAAILGLLANLSDPKRGTPWLRLVLSIVAGGLMVALLPVHTVLAGAAGGLLLGSALALEAGDSKLERVGIWTIYAAALAAAFFTTDTFFGVGPLADFDVPVLQDVLRGGIWSAFLALATGARHVRWSRDEIGVEFDDVAAMVSDQEAKSFLKDAKATYERIREELGREAHSDMRDRAESIATELARGVIGLTKRADELQRNARRSDEEGLKRRIAEIEGRIEKANDLALRRELALALEELLEQMRMRERMRVAVVRIEARQQRYLTGLERLHVTLVHNESIGGQDGALNHSLENLSRLTDEVQWKDLSVEELCGLDFEELEPQSGEESLEELLAEARRIRGEAEPSTGSAAPAEPRRNRTDVDSHQGTDGHLLDGDDAHHDAHQEERVDVEHNASVGAKS